MIHWISRYKRYIAFAYDLMAIPIAYFGSFLLRFDFSIPPEQLANFWKGLPWVIILQALVFGLHGIYRGLWAYASLRDLFLIFRVSILGVLTSVAFLAFLDHRLQGWPRSVFLLDATLLVGLLGAGRFAFRFLKEHRFLARIQRRRVIVVGAGQSGDVIAREMNQRLDLKSQVIAFVDDDRSKVGFSIQGARVMGRIRDLPSVIEKMYPNEIIIAEFNLDGKKIKEVFQYAQASKIPVKIAPPVHQIISRKGLSDQFREVQVEDLLRRDVVEIDSQAIEKFFSGNTVLVTGAGGSIGSELCRQIIRCRPSSILFYERNEFNLFRLMSEMDTKFSEYKDVKKIPILGDILDLERFEATLQKYSPKIVVHAAAYKHVPLLEANPIEGLKNNVLGTYCAIQMASRNGVETFLNVSTDKAVRPANILGVSKRMAERVVHEIGKNSKIKAISVRFGNVLGSDGSVLPTFREQISKGGPVTVTHPEVTRYFMTIPEASSLVLQACVMGKGGEVYLLDMGKPVKILELAEDLIRLSGFTPYEDIHIEFSGLRPGEKLYEELLIDENGQVGTTHPKVFIGGSDFSAKLHPSWEEDVLAIRSLEMEESTLGVFEMIHRWVPEYAPPRNVSSEAIATPVVSPSGSSKKETLVGSTRTLH